MATLPFRAIVQNDRHGAAPDDVEHTISNAVDESVVRKLNRCLVRRSEKFTISITILFIESRISPSDFRLKDPILLTMGLMN